MWGAEMIAVEELWEGAAKDSGRPIIVFNGELDRIRSGYYPVTLLLIANVVAGSQRKLPRQLLLYHPYLSFHILPTGRWVDVNLVHSFLSLPPGLPMYVREARDSLILLRNIFIVVTYKEGGKKTHWVK